MKFDLVTLALETCDGAGCVVHGLPCRTEELPTAQAVHQACSLPCCRRPRTTLRCVCVPVVLDPSAVGPAAREIIGSQVTVATNGESTMGKR